MRTHLTAVEARVPVANQKDRGLWERDWNWGETTGLNNVCACARSGARTPANGLGTITNLKKMAAFLKVSYGARFMVKRESQTENGRKKFLH